MCSHGVWEVFVIFQFYGDPMNLFLPYHVPWVYLLFFSLFSGDILVTHPFARFFKSSKAYRGTTLPMQKTRLLGLEFLESRITPSFANINTIAQSLRLAEDALPQVPGLDGSVGQMVPDRLSDLLGLNAYGNGAST